MRTSVFADDRPKTPAARASVAVIANRRTYPPVVEMGVLSTVAKESTPSDVARGHRRCRISKRRPTAASALP